MITVTVMRSTFGRPVLATVAVTATALGLALGTAGCADASTGARTAGAVPVVLTVGGVASQGGVTVAVR